MPDDLAPTLTVVIDADTTRAAARSSPSAARLGTRFGNALSTSFVDLALKGKSFGDVLRSLGLKPVRDRAARPPSSRSPMRIGGALAGAFSGVGLRQGRRDPARHAGAVRRRRHHRQPHHLPARAATASASPASAAPKPSCRSPAAPTAASACAPAAAAASTSPSTSPRPTPTASAAPKPSSPPSSPAPSRQGQRNL